MTTGVRSGTDWILHWILIVTPPHLGTATYNGNAGRIKNRPRPTGRRNAGYEEMKAQLGSLTSWIDANHNEMKSTVDAFQEKMDAWIANMRDDQKETMACQEMTVAHLECKEPISEDMEFEVEHWEVPR
jgi:hypothetical protein